MTKSKHWVIGFLLVLFLGIGAYMGLNYYANPLGYFTNEKGLTYYYEDDFARSIKAKYVLAHKDEIEGVILGGSKSGIIDPQMLTELTGLNYYNFYITSGNWADYERYIRFFIEQTDIREVTLHLSSYETLYYDRTKTGNNYKVPAVVKGGMWNRFTETLSYLMTDPATVKSALTDRAAKNPAAGQDLTTGTRRSYTFERLFGLDAESAINNHVLNKYDARLAALFSGTVEDDNYEDREECVAAMRRIKAMCDENGMTVKVVIGASSMPERYTYECPGYYDYMRRMVDIFGEVWDFSDFNEINMNPYNFMNEKHFDRTIANLMFSTMYGEVAPGFENKQGLVSVDGFGTLLTPENVNAYLAKRQADFDKLKEEYEETGTVALPGMDDASYINRAFEYKRYRQ